MARERIARLLATAALWVGLWIHAAYAQTPECQIDVLYWSGGDPLKVLFDAHVAGGDPPLAFHWDFGDGGTSNDQTAFHEYSGPGAFDCILTVTPNGMPGAACRDTATIEVGIVSDPLCWASANTTWSEDEAPIQFSAGPALSPGLPPYTFRWNFGDGTSRTIQTNNFIIPPVAHGYATPGTYWAAVSMTDSYGTYNCIPTVRVTTLVPQVPVAVEPPAPDAALRLEPARPNPFGFATALGYALPREGPVRLTIIDLQGRHVATLADGVRSAGRHIAVWQGRADSGSPVAAGVYIAVLEQDGTTTSRRIVRMP
jgi:hypothetical protein